MLLTTSMNSELVHILDERGVCPYHLSDETRIPLLHPLDDTGYAHIPPDWMKHGFPYLFPCRETETVGYPLSPLLDEIVYLPLLDETG